MKDISLGYIRSSDISHWYIRSSDISVSTENGKSESIKQASAKVVNSRDFKTQGQSKIKREVRTKFGRA